MKRINIFGKNPEKIESLKSKIAEKGFIYVEENPDLVICYGGDGMFLIAERVFPNVPKVSIRDSYVGNMACDFDFCEVLDLYSRGEFTVEEIKKLRAVRKGRFEIRELKGVNDIVIRNSLPTEAIRFQYRINEGEWSEVLIGDGLVISTPYGSNKGAYFYSVVQKSFSVGVGVAFNNVTEFRKPLFLSADDFLEVEIVRGIGVMVADNNRDFVNLEKGDVIKVGLINEVARRIVFNESSC